MTKTFTVRSFAKYLKKEMPDATRDAAVRALQRTGDRVVVKAVEYVEKKNRVDTGLFRSAFRKEDVDDGCDVINDAPYAAPLEFGSRPHMPPVAAIEEWVMRKGYASGKDAKSMAWAIAKRISKKGTKPGWFLRNAIRTSKKFFLDAVREEMKDRLG